jgi:hypothetical protein
LAWCLWEHIWRKVVHFNYQSKVPLNSFQNILSSSVFSTVFELRGADVPFFSCRETFYLVKNVLLLKFDGLSMHFYGIWSHFEAFRGLKIVFLKRWLSAIQNEQIHSDLHKIGVQFCPLFDKKMKTQKVL